jgi:hypothetical protein
MKTFALMALPAFLLLFASSASAQYAPQPRVNRWVDAQGNIVQSVERFVPAYNPNTGQMVYQVYRDVRIVGRVNGGGYGQTMPLQREGGNFAQPVAGGANQVGFPNGVAGGPPASNGGNQVFGYAGAPAMSNGGNQVLGNVGSPATGGGGNQVFGNGIPNGGGGNSAGMPGQNPPWGNPGGLPSAPNLGIVFQPITFTDGSIGLVLQGPPPPTSPLSVLPLGAGDIIFALDGQQMRGPADVANHYGSTRVDYQDGQSRVLGAGMVMLPPQ